MASELQTVIGVFEDQDQVQCAEQSLRSAGFGDEDIGVIMRGQPGNVVGDRGTKTTDDVVTGAVAGGVVGGLLGAASLVLPGFGLVLAGGILAMTLAGAATGAVAGGLVGILTGMGLPEDSARYYEQQFQAGRIIVTAKAHGDYGKVYNILRNCGAYDMETRPPAIDSSVRDDRAISLHNQPTNEERAADEGSTQGGDARNKRDSRRVS